MPEKFHLKEGNQDPGDPGVGKVRGGGGGEDFFSFKHGGELTLDDTMDCFHSEALRVYNCLKFCHRSTKSFILQTCTMILVVMLRYFMLILLIIPTLHLYGWLQEGFFNQISQSASIPRKR